MNGSGQIATRCTQVERPRGGGRRGTAALEEVMLLAVMLPLVFAAFVLAKDMCVYVYQIIDTLVGWPFL